jgi:hypothetical protein
MPNRRFPPLVNEAERHATGVAYRELAPGILTFHCEAYRCQLKPSACVARHRRANKFAKLPRRSAIPLSAVAAELSAKSKRCIGCAIGAAHAGQPVGRSSILHTLAICARCGAGTTRLIAGRKCPSCANREYEWIKGKNAKGSFPIRSVKLLPRGIQFVVDGGRVQFFELDRSKDYAELILAVLRRTTGSVMFLPATQAQCAKRSIEHRLPRRRQERFMDEKGKSHEPRK